MTDLYSDHAPIYKYIKLYIVEHVVRLYIVDLCCIDLFINNYNVALISPIRPI